jgi:hypothetical protein
MSTTKAMIRAWLERAQANGATHVIVACDTYDWTDYPVEAAATGDVREIAARHDGPNMSKLMEVYSLSMDWDTQLAEFRARNY